MNILFNNVDFSSRSGPNNFGQKLARELTERGHSLTNHNPDVALSFITGYVPGCRNVLRLDGIYFNSEQEWKKLNDPIQKSYEAADAVIVQSEFNRDLTARYFGKRDNVHVIHNGTCLDLISNVPAVGLSVKREDVWMCASSWRPHKRLDENIRYFQEHATDKSILLVAGSNAQVWASNLSDDRIRIVGDLQWNQMISLMKASGHFLHLALLDHCPNVVVDARASGCQIICSSAGGTKEIAGEDSIVVKDIDWDFLPFELYKPRPLDFKSVTGGENSSLDIKDVARRYESVLEDKNDNRTI